LIDLTISNQTSKSNQAFCLLTGLSDGSEQRINGDRHVTYGYAIYWNRLKVADGRASLNPQSHVFDAEAVGAWRGLQHAIRLSLSIACPRIW
jgi:hypothetical protein